MISVLEQFDKVTAAGILARAALSIEGNPAGDYRLPDEASIREAILREAMVARGIDPNDQRPEALEMLSEALDGELEALIAPRDSKQVLERLSSRGELPSDLFEVEIVPQVEELYGSRFRLEKKLIETTVRTPDREQHYGPHPSVPNEPFLVSLFFKFFPNEYPARSFGMLVGGQRYGIRLAVHHAWHIYPTDVDLKGAETLVDVLRRFADRFGVEMTVGKQKGKFILGGEAPGGLPSIQVSPTIDVPSHGKKKVNISITCFYQRNPNTNVNHAALVTAIDLQKYRAALKAHGGL